MQQYLEKLYNGRIGRKNYVWGLIFFSILSTLMFIISSYFGIFLYIVSYLFISIFIFSLHVRRFHDLGMSGWYIFILLIPIVNLIMFIFYLLLTPGEKSGNKYGEVSQKSKFFNDVFRLE